jgi:DNA helicase-2/ATP-dependent DNA helicase PcrA
LPDLTPTDEQLAIIAAMRSSPQSLLINALAGAAKTTTLVMGAHKLPVQPTLSVAFNKKIADEMAKRMPSFITSKTMNALGHAAWGQARAKRLAVDSSKVYDLMQEEMGRLPPADKRAYGEVFASIKRAVGLSKNYGYIPKKFRGMGTPLITNEEDLYAVIAPAIDCEPDDFFYFHLDRVLELSIAQAFEGKIDFDDQLYMPTLFGAQFPRYPTVLVDEAQDLSALNHLMLGKLVGARLIAVGDPNQAIYGFRGAHKSSMSLLGEQFNCLELGLTTSFRCPIAVVERARFRVPQMNYPSWAKPGKVERLGEWGASHIVDGSAIICRNNAPIFDLALKLLKQGRTPKILGNDLAAGLLKQMKKLGPDHLNQDEALGALKAWENEALAKAHEARKASIRDRADCIRVFIEQNSTLGAAMTFAQAVFEADGKVFLMSGHKSKGLEYDTVYHLDPFRIPSKWAREAAAAGDDSQLQQEFNLRYVIETRAKDTLYLADLEEFS